MDLSPEAETNSANSVDMLVKVLARANPDTLQNIPLHLIAVSLTFNGWSGFWPLFPTTVVPPSPPQSQLPPTHTPTAAPTSSSIVADVLPILDCNAQVNQTHYRAYMSYETRNQGVIAVNVPIGEKNRFIPINAVSRFCLTLTLLNRLTLTLYPSQNQGQPTQFFAGKSTVYKIAVDIPQDQSSVEWILTQYSLRIANTEAARCSNGLWKLSKKKNGLTCTITEIGFRIAITSPTPPSEALINATIDYLILTFNVSINDVLVNISQGVEPNEYTINVIVIGTHLHRAHLQRG